MKTIELEKMIRNNFTHNLANHPLLKFDQIKQLALRHPFKRFNHSKLSRTQNLDTVIEDCPPGMSLSEALENLHSANACIVIRQIQRDPAYAPLIQQLAENVQSTYERSRLPMKYVNAWLFITSPGGVTPYHRDHETTVLFHLSGKKNFYLWDQNDSSVVSAKENEHFHGVRNLSKTVYHDQLMDKSQLYQLNPGEGVFIPAGAPHMVENGTDEYTISLTITYMNHEDFRIQRIYKINQILRKLGFNPTDASHSSVKDKTKLITHALVRTILFYNSNWR